MVDTDDRQRPRPHTRPHAGTRYKLSGPPAARRAGPRRVEFVEGENFNSCPYRKPKTADRDRESLILAPDERSLQVDLVWLDRTAPVAGCLGSPRTSS